MMFRPASPVWAGSEPDYRGSIEQARGVEHVGQAIALIEAVTQNHAASAQQTAENADAIIAQVGTTRQHLNQLGAVVGLKAA